MSTLDEISLSRLYDAPLEVPVHSEEDPTGDLPRFALMRPGSEPGGGDWNDGTWETTWSADTELVTSRTPQVNTTWPNLPRGKRILWYTTANTAEPSQRLAVITFT